MSLRDAIRAATVGSAKDFKKEIVNVNGVDVEIRQLSVGERMEIGTLSRPKDDEETVDSRRAFGVLAILRMCYEPGTETRVYESGDADSILASPSRSWADTLMDHCIDMLNMKTTAEQVAKNSVATLPAS